MSYKYNKKYRQDFWKGTSQLGRLLNEIKPEYIQVDELTLNDLVKFTDQYTRRIHFHRNDTAVPENETWQKYLMKDYMYLLFFMSSMQVEEDQTRFASLMKSAQRSNGFDYQRKKAAGMLHIVLDLATYLYTWLENMERNDHTDELIVSMQKIIVNELKPNWPKLYPIKNLLLYTNQKTEEEVQIDGKFAKLEHKLQPTYVPQGPMQLEIKKEYLEILNGVFTSLYTIINHLSHTSQKLLQRVLKERKDNKSHIALFLAFLQLYKKAQGEMNQITRKHLEFYYNRILLQSPNDVKPDKAYLCLELAKTVKTMVLPEGVGFSAGKDSNGQNLVYNTTDDTQLTQVQLKQIHTLFVSHNPLNYTGLTGQNVTDIFYKKDIQIPEEADGWAPFGEDQFFRGSESKTMEHAPVGFIVASDALYFTEGERSITVALEFDKGSYDGFKKTINQITVNSREKESNTFTQIFITAFDFYLTLDGQEVRMDRFAVKDNPESSGISIHFELAPTDGKLTALKPAKEPPPVPVHKPYIKLLLRAESHIYAYPIMSMLKVANIHIHAAVKGVKNLALYNNFGQINPAVPFPLFGATPQLGSYFLVGSNEIFSKQLQSLAVKINWYQLPQDENGWADYFSGYNADVKNDDYKVALSYLRGGVWFPMHARLEENLFAEETEQGQKTCRLADRTVITPDLEKISYVPGERKDTNPYTNQTRDGYLKLEFTEPKFAFGHSTYVKRLSDVVIYNSKLKDDETPLPEPAPPISPLVSGVEAAYESFAMAYDEGSPTNQIDLYQITPFGYKTVLLRSPYEKVDLLEQFKDEGNLYLGFDEYPEDGNISLFFHLMEGRVEDFLRETPEPRWQYLVNNTWINLDKSDIVEDGTGGFIQSGIIRLRIPEHIGKGNTLADPNLLWIKVSLSRDSNVAADVTAIYVNAVTVQWDGQGSLDHLNDPLPAYTIKKLKDKVTGIKTITQPLASFGAKEVEATNFFYQRVSERLRHRHRAVNVWDYERLVLDRFPVLFKVKCFTANSLHIEAKSEEKRYFVPPGHLKIVVIPDIHSPVVRNILRPKVGMNILANIQRYLKTIASPFAEIDVLNPFYERVRVIASIKLKSGLLNDGYYLNLLNDDLRSYLTPWLWNEDGNDHFGNSVYQSRIMSFIQSRPYVDFVTGFSVIKTWNDMGEVAIDDSARQPDADDDDDTDETPEEEKKINREELKPLYPWSILVSADEHDLTIIRKETYIKPEPRGIDNMLIGSDFIISK